MTLKIVFAGTPEFACHALKALLQSEHQVIAVYTQPDRAAGRGQNLQVSPVKQLAIDYHLPVYQPLRLKAVDDQQILRDLQPDVLIVAAYGLILPTAVLDIPRLGCINIHASLLPRWRGAAPIQHAILANDNTTGISMMQMDAGLDTGEVISTHPCPIDTKDTTATLHDKLAIIGAAALIETLKKLEQGKLSTQKQDPNLATYASKISKNDAKIDWNQSAAVLDCQIRAFNPWPVASTQINNQIIRVWSATPLSSPTTVKPGTILSVTAEGINVATGNGVLKLQELQLPGGKRLMVKEILNSKSDLFLNGSSFIV